jgi:hypothetical protein
MAGIPSIPKINRFLTSGDGDKLSLDLQFATDKTLTARKGPTPTFTRASTATFVGSNGLIQSAAINQARFDHDPVTLESKGLLIEEGRTNLFARSAEFGDPYWTQSQLSISADNQTSPDGSLNADTITAVAQSPSIYRAVACSVSTVYTFSFYVKLGTLSAADYKFAVRDDTNGVFIDSAITPNITPVTTEWRRITYTFTTPVGCVVVRPYLIRSGVNVTGTFFLWGAQLEAGSFPTSYIPTTTSALARSADVCSITGGDFDGFYNPLEGSFATSSIFNAPVSSPVGQIVFDVNDTTSLNRLRTVRGGSNGFLYYSNTVGGVQNVGIVGSTVIATGAVTKLAGCMKANDFAVYMNNVSQGVDTVALMQSSPTTLTIGEVSSGTAAKAPLNGTIASIRYYKKRLSNQKLQALTT